MQPNLLCGILARWRSMYKDDYLLDKGHNIANPTLILQPIESRY